MTSMKTDYATARDLQLFTKARREKFRRTGMISPSMEEHFYPFILERQDSYTGGDLVGTVMEEEEEDPALLLQRKEKDLLLAAELGKALLERNEELGRRNEILQAELTEKLEKLEQEKHDLRLRLEAREGEYELRVGELENDLATMREELKHQRSEQRDTSREKTHAVQELSEQNQRLVEQLSQAAQKEQEMTMDLHALREENRMKTLNSTDYAARLQSLQAENNMLLERRHDLEQQIRLLREESDSSQGLADTFQENSLLLRRQRDEKDLQLQDAQRELEEARGANRRLQLRLKDLSEELHLHDMNSSVTSIQSEIEQCVDSEMEHQEVPKVGSNQEPMMNAGTEHPETTVLSAPGEERVQENNEQNEPQQTAAIVDPSLAENSRKLWYLTQREKEVLREKEEEIYRLQDQITMQHVEITSLREELKQQRILAQNSDLEDVLKQAISDREAAVEKQNQMELQLTQCTLERDSMSRQLMSAIRQKVALSQELEAWQDDMQVVINQQLRAQRQQEKAKPKEPAQGGSIKRTPSRSFSFRRKEAPEGEKDGSGFFSFFKKN